MTPWPMRSVRRKCEKKWRATRDHASRAMLDAQSRIVDTLVNEAKTAFYTRKICQEMVSKLPAELAGQE